MLVPNPGVDVIIHTTPAYPLLSVDFKQFGETNLRLMLANSLFRILSDEHRRVAFVSLHVDSRIDGVPGISIYIPSASMDEADIPTDDPYLRFEEGRHDFHSRPYRDRLRDNEASSALGREILAECLERRIDLCTDCAVTVFP